MTWALWGRPSRSPEVLRDCEGVRVGRPYGMGFPRGSIADADIIAIRSQFAYQLEAVKAWNWARRVYCEGHALVTAGMGIAH